MGHRCSRCAGIWYTHHRGCAHSKSTSTLGERLLLRLAVFLAIALFFAFARVLM